MRNLPTGTVAFLMTDIEGSTRLITRIGAAFPSLLDDHLAVLEQAITSHGGTLVSTEGDSAFAVFPSVREAIDAAVVAQRALAAHPWPDGVELGVRIGIHVGEAVLGGADYTGIDVHRTARVMAAGHGGQVLVTQSARDLAAGAASEQAGFRDLGVVTLRDIPEPEHLYQVLAPGITSDFPPPRSERRTTQATLPTFLTRFIGRTKDIAAVSSLIERERMVTLTGPGGTGKTRLAVEAASSLAARYPDGIWFLALDAIHDPGLVLPAIATALGVPDQAGRTIGVVLGDYLNSRRTLVLLDNFEQVIEAATDVGTLLGAAPGLDILVTSRVPLAIAGEHVYQVEPLELPAEPGVPTARDISANEAVALFVERASAVRSDFSLTDSNAPAIAAICRRLDGLPLAIELAAARVSLFSADQIVARLDHRMALLTASRHDLPPRQRTLRGAIDWSHDLLTAPEKTFFGRFSVFSNGADFDAIQAVIDPSGSLGTDTVELASALVDQSLLRLTRSADGNRLAMLETIREYAAEQLALSPVDDRETRARHAKFYVDLAEAWDALTNAPRDELLDRLDLELPNFRAAIAWSLEAQHPETGLRIAATLADFWNVRNHLIEGRRLLAELLAASEGEGATSIRLRGLTASGMLASMHGDYAVAGELLEGAVAMSGAGDDQRQLAMAKMGLGYAVVGPRPVSAREDFEDAIAISRSLGDERILFAALSGLALACIRLGDLGVARQAVLEAIALGEASGERYGNAMNLLTLGLIEARDGHQESADRRLSEGIRQLQTLGGHSGLSVALDVLATLAIERGEPARGVRLAAAADRLRREVGGGPSTAIILLEEPLDIARRTMASADFEMALAAGRALTTDEAVALGLETSRSGNF